MNQEHLRIQGLSLSDHSWTCKTKHFWDWHRMSRLNPVASCCSLASTSAVLLRNSWLFATRVIHGLWYLIGAGKKHISQPTTNPWEYSSWQVFFRGSEALLQGMFQVPKLEARDQCREYVWQSMLRKSTPQNMALYCTEPPFWLLGRLGWATDFLLHPINSLTPCSWETPISPFNSIC